MKKIVLNESILDIDKWLPQEAIDQMVEIILHLEEIENKKLSRKDINTRVHLMRRHAISAVEKNCRCDVVWMRMRLG